jgi:dihydrofolate reductase
MGRIVVSENITLDGVIQDPSGDEGFERGGWLGKVTDREEAGRVLAEETLGAEAELYGRRTYEFLASRWPARSGALADRLNTMPKYVISSSLEDPKWSNTTVLTGDVLEEVWKLRQEVGGEILVPASIKLVRTLLEHDLVDELRLTVFPVVLGAGERLFGEAGEVKPMRLVNTRTLDDELAYLTYELVRAGSQ